MSKTTSNENESRSETKPMSKDSADLVKQIKASAKEIWLAGLGAFSQRPNDTESSQMPSLYKQLVKEGRDIERVSREQFDRNLQSVKTLAVGGVDQVKEKAAGSFHRIESLFDERVSRALSRLGLTTNQDYAVLQDRLDHAEQRIADLEGIVASLDAEKK